LAGSLGLITGRSPLNNTLQQNLRNQLDYYIRRDLDLIVVTQLSSEEEDGSLNTESQNSGGDIPPLDVF
jgi:hypothetical protein